MVIEVSKRLLEANDETIGPCRMAEMQAEVWYGKPFRAVSVTTVDINTFAVKVEEL